MQRELPIVSTIGTWYAFANATSGHGSCIDEIIVRIPFHSLLTSVVIAMQQVVYSRKFCGFPAIQCWSCGACLLACGIRSVLWTVTGSHWRHFYFRSTSMFSALEVCYENALYKFTFDIDIDIARTMAADAAVDSLARRKLGLGLAWVLKLVVLLLPWPWATRSW